MFWIAVSRVRSTNDRFFCLGIAVFRFRRWFSPMNLLSWGLSMCNVCSCDCWEQLDSKHEAASAYVDAANCYKKSQPQGQCATDLQNISWIVFYLCLKVWAIILYSAMKVFCWDNQKIRCFGSLHLRLSGCVYSMEILCVMQRQCGCWTMLSTCLRTLGVFLWLPNITRYCEVVILYVGHFWFLQKLWSSDESPSFLLVYAWFTDQFWGTLFTS